MLSQSHFPIRPVILAQKMPKFGQNSRKAKISYTDAVEHRVFQYIRTLLKSIYSLSPILVTRLKGGEVKVQILIFLVKTFEITHSQKKRLRPKL